MSPSQVAALVGLFAFAAGLTGCGPRHTYRTDQVTGAIEQLARDEYGMRMTARPVGNTLAVHLSHAGLIMQDGERIQLQESAHETLGNALEIVHRVLLSTDYPCAFYIFIASDPNVPGAGFTIVRYLDDVRRANASVIPPSEFLSRTVLDLTYVDTVKGTLEQWVPSAITLEQFLTWQLARRIQSRLAEQLQTPEAPPVQNVRCAGEFKDGEFAFTLNLTPEAGQSLQPDAVEKMFEHASTEIAQVLSGYRFHQFTAVRLTHPLSGRSLLLPKINLELFR
jgi:hypothetical protein